MNKSECACMQCMAGTNSKTIFYKLLILTEYGSFYNFITTIKIIIEQWMTDVFHVHTDLVCTASFKHTLYQRNIPESFDNFIMRDSFFSMIALRISFKQFSEPLVTANMRNDCSTIFLNIAPDQRKVLSFDG